MKKDVVFTYRSKKSTGAKFPKLYYDLISDFIFDELLVHDTLTLSELLVSAEQKLSLPRNMDLHWSILHVKLDLQVRDQLAISFGPGCLQTIKIGSEAKRKLKPWYEQSPLSNITQSTNYK